MPSDHELETCAYIISTDDKVEWYSANVAMDINMPYGDESCVA